MRKKTILESPYSGDVDKNIDYAKKCLRDSLERDECPFASHLLYTQVLNDRDKKERWIGMSQAFEWYEFADQMILYTDLGISKGMLLGVKQAVKHNIPIFKRSIL